MGFLDRLFGSPKGTDAADQLFERVAKSVFRQLDNATQPYVGYGETRETDWWTGGLAAAKEATKTIPSIGRAWGDGNVETAGSLACLFTFPMVPRYYRRVRSAKTRDERQALCKQGFSRVAGMYQIRSLGNEKPVREYMQLTRQFEYSEDHRLNTGRTRAGFLEARYLLSRALTVCGQPSEFELLDVRFPVNSETEFVDRGGKRGQLDEGEVFALDAIVGRIATGMGRL